MFLIFDDRPSDSPFVERIWRSRSEQGGLRTSRTPTRSWRAWRAQASSLATRGRPGLIPRTAILGAVLLTGYLGGATATHVRVGSPLLRYTFFPIYVAAIVWGGIYLRDARLPRCCHRDIHSERGSLNRARDISVLRRALFLRGDTNFRVLLLAASPSNSWLRCVIRFSKGVFMRRLRYLLCAFSSVVLIPSLASAQASITGIYTLNPRLAK